MEKFTTLADAVALAEFAHRNQRDKAGMPYIDHPNRVLAAVQGLSERHAMSKMESTTGRVSNVQRS